MGASPEEPQLPGLQGQQFGPQDLLGRCAWYSERDALSSGPALPNAADITLLSLLSVVFSFLTQMLIFQFIFRSSFSSTGRLFDCPTLGS